MAARGKSSIHTMKIQPLPIAFFDKNSSSPSPGFKLRRPLALTLPPAPTNLAGARWNPTEEQIRMLENLYSGGMRTPNALQIERITSELVGHGRIEGKNVFYWFQNHKARERQKQRRGAAVLPHRRQSILDNKDNPSPATSFIFSDTKPCETEEEKEQRNIEEGILKKKRRTRSNLELEMGFNGCRTLLHLFPLQPENFNGS